MGLAASQARLLMLTSRKGDVENNLMSIANNKLSISRESAALSQAYSDTLSSRKLTWDTTKTSNGTTPLNYDLLMIPNDINTSGQYLISDAYGRVMLDTKYANIFSEGNSNVTSGNDANGVSAAQFLLKMGAVNTLDAGKEAVAKVEATSQKKGVELTKMSTDAAKTISYYIDDAKLHSDNTQNSYNDNTLEAFKLALNTMSADVVSEIQTITGLQDSEIAAIDNNQWTTLKYNGEGDTLVSDSFKQKMGCTPTDGKYTDAGYSKKYQELEYLVRIQRAVAAAQQLLTLYEGNSGNYNGIGEITIAISLLLKGGTARTFTNLSGEPTNMLLDGIDQGNYFEDNQAGHPALSNDGGECTTYLDYNFNGVWKDTTCGATDNAYYGGTAMFTEDIADLFSNYKTIRAEREEEEKPTTSADKLTFYVELWKAINQQGWSKCDAVSKDKDPDGTYLQNLMLNGGAYLYKLDSSGDWGIASTSDSSTPLNNEIDEDAIAAAEAEYDAGKDRLNYKEAQLSIQSNNFDVERSALTTEMESVQKIIDGNVKVLKMFSSTG